MLHEQIATDTSRPPSARRHQLKTRTALIGAAFFAPAVLLMLYSSIIPTIWTYILSLQTGDFRNPTWNGVQNYIVSFSDALFLRSLWNSLFIAVVSTIFAMIIGVALALLIYRMGQIEGAVYRFIIFMPSMLPLTITGLLFIFVFNQEAGILNNALRAIGLDNLAQAWLAKPPLNLYTLCAVNVWRGVGLPMILTFAALQSVPISLLEASKLDGATYFDQIRLVLLPLLKPIILTATTFLLIGNFKAYDLVMVLTRGGPANTSRIVPLHIVETAFTFNNFGGAASMGVVMTVVVLAVIGITRLILRSETYEY